MIYNALYLMMNVFRTYVIYKFLSLYLSERKVNAVIEFLTYLGYFIVISGLYLIWDIPVLTLAGNIVALFALTSIYQDVLRRRILGGIYIYAILFTAECLVAVVTNYIPLDIFRQGDYRSIIGLICVPILPYIVVLLLQNYKRAKKSIEVPSTYWIASVAVPSISIYLIVELFAARKETDISMIVEVGMLLVLDIIVFGLYEKQNSNFEKIHENELLEVQNESYRNQLVLLEKMSEQTRAVRHDLKNHLFVVQRFIQEKEYDKLESYLQESSVMENIMVSYANTGNTLVDSLINYKLQEIEAQNVEIALDLKIMSQIGIEPFDITVVLGNLLDNAIRAVKKCDTNRRISLSMLQHAGYLKIHMQNTYKEPIRLEKGRYLTDKKDIRNHGIGLCNVKKTVQKYQGEMKIDTQNQIFDVNILLYTKQK